MPPEGGAALATIINSNGGGMISDECKFGFCQRCKNPACTHCTHLPVDPLLRAVELYNRRAPAAKWKPPKLHFDQATNHYVLFEVAKVCRTEMPEESRLIFNEANRRYTLFKRSRATARQHSLKTSTA